MASEEDNARNSPSESYAILGNALHEGGITQELVCQIADKVYAMLLLELRIERERERLTPKMWGPSHAG